MKLNIQLFAYTKKEWKDLPSKETPILAADLNNIENGIATNLSPDAYYGKTEIDNKVNNLKAENEYLNSVIEQAFTPVEKEGTSINYDNTINARFKDIKLCGDTTQNGTPTPDTPVPVEVVTGDNSINICGKNFLPYQEFTTKTMNGITFTNNNDGTYKVNGTSTADCSVVVYDTFIPMSGTWRMLGCPSGGSDSTYMLSAYVGYWGAGSPNIDTGNGTNITYTGNVKVRFYIKNGTTCNNLIFKPMITTDTSATYNSFEPYKGTSYPINFGDIELCKIGDYQDKIYKNNGKWYLEKQIGKVNLEDYKYNKNGASVGYSRHTTTQIPNIKYVSVNTELGKGLCEKYQIHTGSGMGGNDAENHFAIDVSMFQVTIPNNDTPSGLFYYVLATPTTTEITDTTLLEQLEELAGATTYAGETNIVAISDGLTIIPKTTALTK